jgi:drug/metabolite transporter (DMT)-like permease
MNWKTIGLMILSTFAFAVVNMIIKFMDEYSGFQLVFFRSAVSLTITVIQLRILKVNIWGINKPILLLRGISGVVALIMMYILIKNISLGTAVMLQYLSPISTALIAVFWLKERISFKQWLYLFLCVVGVGILKWGSMGLSFQMLLLGLGSAGFSGLAYNCIRICKETDHPLVAVLYFPLVGTPVALLLTFLLSDWISPSWNDLGLILVLGLFTQIAQVSMTKALQSDKAANVAVFKYLGVIHAFVIGWLIFGEPISLITIIGIGVILTGIILFSKFKKP